jgi:hypothetical protein
MVDFFCNIRSQKSRGGPFAFSLLHNLTSDSKYIEEKTGIVFQNKPTNQAFISFQRILFSGCKIV